MVSPYAASKRKIVRQDPNRRMNCPTLGARTGTIMNLKGVSREDFGRLHPGGALGARLKPVKRLMHSGSELPLTSAGSSMHDAIVEMTAKRLGVIGVVDDDGYLVGVITDGDLRRNMEASHLASSSVACGDFL